MRTIIRNNYDPKNGDYHETIIIDDERNKKYVFDCDGVFTDFTNPRVVSTRGDSEDFAASQKWVTEIDDKVDGLADDLGDEIQARTDADDAIWAEIEEIEMSSDVVDIVGTYAELQQYDTTHLNDNDIIKVLSDETHQNETAYYRWSTATDTFSYVGSEGPYYTESEVDTLLDGKQDTLIAGSNIQIAADGKTISATDTTYTHFTGATASADGVQGLVPGPLAGDEDKFLKGDGTWATVQSSTNATVFYLGTDLIDAAEYDPNHQVNIFSDSGLTNAATVDDVINALRTGLVYFRYFDTVDVNYVLASYSFDAGAPFQCRVVDSAVPNNINSFYLEGSGNDTYLQVTWEKVQERLLAGTNIRIINNTISAPVMTGATSSTNGTAGVVPQPLSTDSDKFLKGDGTWATVQSGAAVTTFYISGPPGITTTLYKDVNLQQVASSSDLISACSDGPVKIGVVTTPGTPLGVYYDIVTYDDETGAPYQDGGTYRLGFDGHYSFKMYWDTTTSIAWVISEIQSQLTAGTGITISSGNVISAPGAVTNNINSTDWNALWQ